MMEPSQSGASGSIRNSSSPAAGGALSRESLLIKTRWTKDSCFYWIAKPTASVKLKNKFIKILSIPEITKTWIRHSLTTKTKIPRSHCQSPDPLRRKQCTLEPSSPSDCMQGWYSADTTPYSTGTPWMSTQCLPSQEWVSALLLHSQQGRGHLGGKLTTPLPPVPTEHKRDFPYPGSQHHGQLTWQENSLFMSQTPKLPGEKARGKG